MPEKRCENLQEAAQSPNAGYLLSVLHAWAANERSEEFRRVSLRELFADVKRFRRAVGFLFRANPNFDTPEIREDCSHVEGLIAGGSPPLSPLDTLEPLAFQEGQAEIPADILNLGARPEKAEYSSLIARVGFEPERDRLTQHSRAFDRAVLAYGSSSYCQAYPFAGPNRDFAELLREPSCLLSSLGEFVRIHFPGMQLVDVGAGSSEGIANWAELFQAKACVYVDKKYHEGSHLKRGAMDFYRVPGDALHVLSQLPEGFGSFHVAGMELLPFYETHFDGKTYLRALAAEMYKKTASGGLVFVGQMHCSLSDDIVLAAGFKPVEIPRINRGFESFRDMDWRRNYQVYRKEV
ncbi:hypothetical protein HY605_05045 [Candidatus Peregrinibacteria bacterium]|nr:hypothetical protein [Candidatus Peregrinibacteria bacterium]